MHQSTLLWTLALWCSLAAGSAWAGPTEEDEALLREAKLETDAKALLEFFRKRTLPEIDPERIRVLIRKLGDDSFSIREKASADLITLGPGIAPLLRQAAGNEDPEVAQRVKECLEIAEKTSTLPLISAAARLLAHHKPPEAARVLLDFAPAADGEEVVEVLRDVLAPLAQREGKPDPALEAALEDKLPVRRSLAVETLIRAKGINGKDAKQFLEDPSALVRLRAALALIERSERGAVPVLIESLSAVTLQQAWQAEDVLHRLAGEQAPQVSLGTSEASRKQASLAWQRWWKDNAVRIDLAKLKERPPFLGLTLVAFQNNRGQGQVMELGRDGKPRWQIENLAYPVDVQVIGERVLIAEMNGARVTERNRKGEVVWQKQIQQPIACQRLSNGNTMVATPMQLFEFDAKGNTVFTYNRGRREIMGARKHRNGEYVLVTRNQVIRIDKKGQQVNAFRIPLTSNWSSFDILPSGNLLVPLHRSNRVVEYTLDGKEVWAAQVPFPTSAQRLPNGNVVVASMNHQRVTEVDRTGKQVSQTQVQGTPWCVLRR